MLSFMGLIVGIGFSKTQIIIGLLIMLIHPVGGAEPIVGALQTERYGREIIQEIERDYPTLTLHKSLRVR